MQKRYNIRWRQVDENKLSKEVKNFNAKRARIIKKDPSASEYLPQKLVKKDLKNQIETRRDLNKTLKSLERFSAKTAQKIETEQGVKTTKYEIKEISIRVASINRQRAIERKKADVSTERGTMGTIRANNLQPKKFNVNKIKKSDWNKFKESVEKQVSGKYGEKKNEIYKQNFLKALDTVYGGSKTGKELRKLFENVPAGELVRMYYGDSELQIDFIYSEESKAIKANYLKEHFQKWQE